MLNVKNCKCYKYTTIGEVGKIYYLLITPKGCITIKIEHNQKTLYEAFTERFFITNADKFDRQECDTAYFFTLYKFITKRSSKIFQELNKNIKDDVWQS